MLSIFFKIKNKIATLINFFLLTIVYFLGIGLTSIVAKIFGKRFFKSQKKLKSNFVNFKQISKLERMF